MTEDAIVKYINNMPIQQSDLAKDLKDRDNGCVQGPPCPSCFWSKGPQGCSSGVYCSKPEHSPCPGQF